MKNEKYNKTRFIIFSLSSGSRARGAMQNFLKSVFPEDTPFKENKARHRFSDTGLFKFLSTFLLL
jgi:hypothetical protein